MTKTFIRDVLLDRLPLSAGIVSQLRKWAATLEKGKVKCRRCRGYYFPAAQQGELCCRCQTVLAKEDYKQLASLLKHSR